MNRSGTDGIINAQPLQCVNGDNDDDSRKAAEKHCTGGADPITRAGDRNQASQESIRRVAGIPLFEFEVAVKDGGESCSARRKGCVCGNTPNAYQIHGGQCAARIKSVPPEPENKSTSDCNRQIVWQHGLAAVPFEFAAKAWTKNNCTRQRNEPADGVDHC